jgi:hypothetical protein
VGVRGKWGGERESETINSNEVDPIGVELATGHIELIAE